MIWFRLLLNASLPLTLCFITWTYYPIQIFNQEHETVTLSTTNHHWTMPLGMIDGQMAYTDTYIRRYIFIWIYTWRNSFFHWGIQLGIPVVWHRQMAGLIYLFKGNTSKNLAFVDGNHHTEPSALIMKRPPSALPRVTTAP